MQLQFYCSTFANDIIHFLGSGMTLGFFRGSFAWSSAKESLPYCSWISWISAHKRHSITLVRYLVYGEYFTVKWLESDHLQICLVFVIFVKKMFSLEKVAIELQFFNEKRLYQ